MHLEPPHEDGRVSTALHATGLFPSATRLQAVVAGLPTTVSTLMRNVAQAGRATRRQPLLELELLNAEAEQPAPRFDVLRADAATALGDVAALARNPCRLEFRLLRGGQPVYLDGLIAASADAAAAAAATSPRRAAPDGGEQGPAQAELEFEAPEPDADDVAVAASDRSPAHGALGGASAGRTTPAAPVAPAAAQRAGRLRGRRAQQVSCNSGFRARRPLRFEPLEMLLGEGCGSMGGSVDRVQLGCDTPLRCLPQRHAPSLRAKHQCVPITINNT